MKREEKMDVNNNKLTFEGMQMGNKGSSVTIERVALNKIKLGRNSRAKIDKDELEGLMESIKAIGLLQPIGVVKNGTGYDIAYGNRRFLACSKLGLTHIPVIVHTYKKSSEIDIKNLAENVQRKNISLTEVGRYVSLLRGEGMTIGEIAIRLGAPRGYVETCEKAYKNVPKEFREDLVAVAAGKSGVAAGKIASSTAMKILNATRTYRLGRVEEKKLFKEARDNDAFEPTLIQKYAKQLKAGNDDFVKANKKIKHIRLSFCISEAEHDKLRAKYVDEGPFNSVSAALIAALMGKVSLTLDVISGK